MVSDVEAKLIYDLWLMNTCRYRLYDLLNRMSCPDPQPLISRRQKTKTLPSAETVDVVRKQKQKAFY